MAFVDDFFAIVPQKVAETVFDQFKWFVTRLLGFHLKTEKGSPPNSEGMLLGVWVNLLPGGNGEFFLIISGYNICNVSRRCWKRTYSPPVTPRSWQGR